MPGSPLPLVVAALLAAPLAVGCRDEAPPVSSPEASPASPLRRLNRLEYDNTVRDLLADDTAPARSFPADTVVDGFDDRADALVASPLLLEGYMNAAERLAAAAVTRGDVVPCEPGATRDSEAACARQLITTLGQRAFRRPLDPDTVTSFAATFDVERERGTFASAVGAVIERMLQSPRFLYRLELAPEPDGSSAEAVPLDGWAIASRLSYFLWRTMPDERLFQLAADDALGTERQVVAEATRMLADPRAAAMMRDFHDQWLDLRRLDDIRKTADLYPDFTPAMVASMRESVALFVDDVVWAGGGDLRALLTAPYAFVDSRLAPVYGVEPPPSPAAGGGFRRVDLDPADRAGILTQPGLLAGLSRADASSPVLRGRFVRERLLCGHVSSPPLTARIVLPDPVPGVSTRQRFEAHVTNETCAGCHTLMDPIGFGFERYDAIGRIRDQDEGQPVDASGEIVDGDVRLSFDGAPELSRLLAEREDVAACLVVQWFRYAMGRDAGAGDRSSMTDIGDRFTASGGRIQDLVLAVAGSHSFRYRSGEAEANGEGNPP